MADETSVENTENGAETPQTPVTDNPITPTIDAEATGETAPAKKTAAKKTTRKRTTKKTTGARSSGELARPLAPSEGVSERSEQAAAPAEAVEAPAAETADAAENAEAPAKKAAAKKTTRKRTTKKSAAPAPAEVETAAETAAPEVETPETPAEPVEAPAKKTAAKKTTAKKAAAKKSTVKKAAPVVEPVETTGARSSGELARPLAPREGVIARSAKAPVADAADETDEETEAEQAGPVAPAVLFQPPTKTTTRRRTRKTAEPKPVEEPVSAAETPAVDEPQAAEPVVEPAAEPAAEPVVEPVVEPAAEKAPARSRRRNGRSAAPVEEKSADEEQAEPAAESETATDTGSDTEAETDSDDSSVDDGEGGGNGRRRRRRGGRRRRKGANGDDGPEADSDSKSEDSEAENDEAGKDSDAEQQGEGGTSRRRRRRRRAGEASGDGGDDPENTVTKVRQSRTGDDQITALAGSTRLEAKKQRRREGREAGRRRAPIVSEAEFLARRESVERVMVIREREDLTQIAVLEDKVLVEHYVARESQTSLIGNVYLGRVQNVLPSMEAAFIDIGKGRNAVLYAGEVNWPSLGWKEGQPRKIESVLTSGQKVLVQVTKDPVGHKGARLTSQISLAGRFLVYVPDGTTSGISRKLPDTERNRLKTLLKEIVPDTAGVIVRTAAEGAAEDELTRDVERLKARWEDIEKKAGGNGPQLLYGEPDLTLKVVRDLFTEDFAKLVIAGDSSWETVKDYVQSVAPDLEERVERYDGDVDAFAAYRIDEQIAKGLDRKVWLPSGGSLIIDRTEAMTVVDVNTGKFTGSGGNLEETVTKNNLEAAEEMVRQLRLRDIGGIIVVDFIDMVLESNRDLVLRRLVECLGRDRTRHQVAEVTSLGLVQMTRKRIGTGLLEAFSENCDACAGRGLVIHEHPVEAGKSSGVAPDEPRSRRRGGRGTKGKGKDEIGNESRTDAVEESAKAPSPAEFAAMAKQSEAAAAATESAETAPEAETVEPAAVVEPAEAPKVTTRTRSRRSRASKSDEPVVAETVEAVETAPEAAETAPEVAEAPKVTTRTRSRRSKASAPAEATTESKPESKPEAPTETPVEPAAEPEAPKVTTRTRTRRTASTGRPVLAAVVGSSSVKEPKPKPEPVASEPEPVEPVEPVAAEAPAPVAPPEPEATQPETTQPETTQPEVAEVAPVKAEPVDSKPKVVTRQRRGARREVVTTGEGAVMTAAKSEAPVVSNGTASTPAPKVVTRTRGGASRSTTPSADS
ncbi:Rne/Rng family ribonuclease [Nocardioides panzhihuensis]|uniref:Ribonuclease E n=1 Tax=Nocardioides panzhihuensis TaxID=860243 RepID=A0A7Z0IQQ2_9ACTN|nr:Rne/Rng family ribonuclease [Nocardioides panzhihuensis]NYI76174.1 ribonuclease E [Nocardioides panzhihuensis]